MKNRPADILRAELLDCERNCACDAVTLSAARVRAVADAIDERALRSQAELRRQRDEAVSEAKRLRAELARVRGHGEA